MKSILKRILCFGATVILSFSISIPSFAIEACSKYAYGSKEYKECFRSVAAQNEIMFYDGSDGGCSTMVGGNNYNYNGAEIISSAQMKQIEENRPFYEKAVKPYGFDWKILAVIHIHEHSLRRDNPSNGQGAFQLYSYTDGGKNENAFLPAGEISDEEFQRQADIAAKVISGKSEGLDLNTDEGIKKLFFKYNGMASSYVEQAKALGFSEEEARNGEGSPYVMNRFDARRDPTVEPTRSNNSWGQIKYDGGGMLYPANNGFGAFVHYMALGGSSNHCAKGRLVSGGLSLDEAKEFVSSYVDEQNRTKGLKQDIEFGGVVLNYYKSCGHAMTNCVAFSRWFLSEFTSAPKGMIPNDDGGVFVSVMINNGWEDGGIVPRAYAIFSSSDHTGVVLGVDEERGKIIIGEAGCSLKNTANYDFTGAKEYNLEPYQSGKYHYAYTDSYLNL